jgi:hypothetical protein
MLFGKLKPEFHDTDLLFENLMRAAPVPPSYDADTKVPVPIADNPMFANDQYGDCVMAARAHQTRRFEDLEQSQLLNITEQEVIDEYMRETGGQDSGLVMSRSFKAWKNRGWQAAGRSYRIYAYSRLRVGWVSQIHQGMAADLGIQIGFTVTQEAMDQFDAGQPWELTTNQSQELGGHCVYCVAYEPGWITVVTWGKRQKMSEEFFRKYTDEAWGILDARNRPRKGLIDLNALDDFLSRLPHP